MPILKRLVATVPAVWTAWVIARILLGLIILNDYSPRGDVAYYFYGEFGDDPTMMTEYPHAGTWPVEVLTFLIGNRIDAFYIAFVLMCMLFDALFLAFVLRGHQNNSRVYYAGWLWVFFGTLTGQVFYMRLDIFPALAVAAAAACIVRWPNIAAALLAFATTMKLWPGVLAAGLVGRLTKGKTWLRLLSFFGALIALCAVTVFTRGWDRLISPLTYQENRGLQIESIPATPFIYQAFFEPERWEMGYASSKSFEISGPGVDQAITWSTYAMIATIAFALLWALWRFFVGTWHPRSTIAFFAVMVLLLIATNKVFSPQYIVWFGPLLAVAIRQPKMAGTPKTHVVIRVLLALLALLTLVCAGLGSFVYPANYNFIWQDVGVEYAPVAALALRNILIVVMAVLALIWLTLETWCDWKMSKHDPSAETSPASAPLATTPGADASDAVPASVASPSAANPSTATPSTPDSGTASTSQASTSEASARDTSENPGPASSSKASPQAISAESP